MVFFLGLGDQLVGISADSDWPPELVQHLPVLNTVAFNPDVLSSAEIDAAASGGHRGASLFHVDAELLRTLRPELILTQELCSVCAVSRGDVDRAANLLGYCPRILSLNPLTIDEMLQDLRSVAAAARVAKRGATLVDSLQRRLDILRENTAPLGKLRVCCMEWLDPPYSAGHWVPQMVQYAGGHDVLGTLAGPSRRVEWQDILDCRPEALILIPCSLSLERVGSEFGFLRTRPGWETLPAVKSGRVFAGHTHLFSQSGPRLVDGAEALARMLHPDIFLAPLLPGQALKMSADGQVLEPY
jgi:iron complex transport system substrate-binding protein